MKSLGVGILPVYTLDRQDAGPTKAYGFGEILSVSSRLMHYVDSLANLASYDLSIRIAAEQSPYKEPEVA